MDYVVIMAGGSGKRLWPLSRQKRPKQVLKLLNGQTLLRRCFERLSPMFDARNILVMTSANYVDTIIGEVPEILPHNVIAEPAVRDTAGAIGLAASILIKYDPDATMALVTADQIIEPDEVLRDAIKDALSYVKRNPEELLTFGIEPVFPSEQLGYIKCGKPGKVEGCKNEIYDVEGFREKPNRVTATEYLASGNYFWNSGMFVWKARTILENLDRFLPASTGPLKKIQSAWATPTQQRALEEWFPKLPKISIDFAVMERAEKVKAIKLACRWLDMGAFTALADLINSDANNNIVIAEANELIDCRNNIIVTEEGRHLIAAIGLENITVVHTPDVTLICPTEETCRLKELLDVLKEHGRDKYL